MQLKLLLRKCPIVFLVRRGGLISEHSLPLPLVRPKPLSALQSLKRRIVTSIQPTLTEQKLRRLGSSKESGGGTERLSSRKQTMSTERSQNWKKAHPGPAHKSERVTSSSLKAGFFCSPTPNACSPPSQRHNGKQPAERDRRKQREKNVPCRIHSR